MWTSAVFFLGLLYFASALVTPLKKQFKTAKKTHKVSIKDIWFLANFGTTLWPVAELGKRKISVFLHVDMGDRAPTAFKSSASF
jgi:hypothetical protein